MDDLRKIMTANPVSVTQHVNIYKARMMMAEKKIRHIPVQDIDSGKVIGLLSQKDVLAHAIKTINQRGFEQLEHTEKSINVATIMDDSPAVFNISDSLVDVGKMLLAQRSGCVSIVENNQLVGVITSSDFVKVVVNNLTEKS